MSVLGRWWLVFALFSAACASLRTEPPLQGALACGAVIRVGTFSDLRAVPSGVMNGTEVRLVLVNDQVEMQGSFQFAESDGTLSGLIVANVHDKHENDPVGVPIEGDGEGMEIWADLPEPYAGRLEGRITAAALKGILTFTSGKVLTLDLPRCHSYWD